MTTNSPSQTYNETADCSKCGRQYPKHASSMRLQYYCPYCGSDIHQEQIRPLLVHTAIPKPENHTRNVGVLLTSLLLLTTLIIAYFTVINPDASDDPDHGQLIVNTTAPSLSPTTPTLSPTTAFPTEDTPNPTSDPTISPTLDPTINPTLSPTVNPTSNPTIPPTIHPTGNPSIDPTQSPTTDPTQKPTHYPTTDPTEVPPHEPTTEPTTNPTYNPTSSPTNYPTIEPTKEPTYPPINTNTLEAGLSVTAAGMAMIGVVICIIVAFKARESKKQKEMMGATRRQTRDEVSRNYTEIHDTDNDTASGVNMT